MRKTIAIMQPYFLPYIGYWQLLHLVDEFVVYDNIQYTKKGWINRNRYLCEGQDKYFTLQLEKASDFLGIRDRRLSVSFAKDKLLHQIKAAYQRAPFFEPAYEVFETIMMCKERNLFTFVFNSIKIMADYLDIKTKMIVSSQLAIDHSLTSSQKVLAICKNLEADRYINPIGGLVLYDKENFLNNAVKLEFLKAETIQYKQIGNTFIPSLSILDVLMFNGVEKTKQFLDLYSLE